MDRSNVLSLMRLDLSVRYLVYWKLRMNEFNFRGTWKIGVDSEIRRDGFEEEFAEGPHEVVCHTANYIDAFQNAVGLVSRV